MLALRFLTYLRSQRQVFYILLRRRGLENAGSVGIDVALAASGSGGARPVYTGDMSAGAGRAVRGSLCYVGKKGNILVVADAVKAEEQTSFV